MPKKPRRPAYVLVDLDADDGRAVYALLRQLVDAHHPELAQARIAVAWNQSWRPNVDGHLVLGKCQRLSELQREVTAALPDGPLDFVVVLLREFWTDPSVTDAQRRALLDHELSHAMPALDDESGDQRLDAHDRPAWRLRKHDVEEFDAVVERHGIWKRDLQRFAEALLRGRRQEAEALP